MESFSARYFAHLAEAISHLDTEKFDKAIALVQGAWLARRQIITLGNGGSAMTALHFNADWSKSLYLAKNIPFRGRSLVDNLGLLTAYSNDLSYDEVFVGQLRNILEPGDLVIAISGSGNSENVIRAVEYANENGAITLGLSGFGGGRLKSTAQHNLWINVHDMQMAEDIHAIFGHLVVQALS